MSIYNTLPDMSFASEMHWNGSGSLLSIRKHQYITLMRVKKARDRILEVS